MRQKPVPVYQALSAHIFSTACFRRILVTAVLFVLLFALSQSSHAYMLPSEKISKQHEDYVQYPVASAVYALEKNIAQVGLAYRQANREYLQAAGLLKRGERVLAKRLLLPLASNGYRDAQFLLGVLYDAEEGVADLQKNLKQSFFWYKAAALQGHVDAQHNLGMAYARGEGVEADMQKALYWWERAARQGNADSQYNLGIVYAMGVTGVEQDLQQARNWWLRAAEKGDAAAQYNLGALYASDMDGKQNYCEAAHWWYLSQANGFSQAYVALENLGAMIDISACE